MTSFRWAGLLCKFSRDNFEPYPRQRFEKIFTSVGNGKVNMLDDFRDMSHGKLDLTGSQVFPSSDKGWYTLAQTRSDYAGTATKGYGRSALLVWARQAAAANGDDLSGFANIVVVTNVFADLYGGLDGVATDDDRNGDNGMTSLSPSLLGQEMSHGYGFNHARIDGSLNDYMDPFDIMSTATAFMAPHPVYRERDVRAQPICCDWPRSQRGEYVCDGLARRDAGMDRGIGPAADCDATPAAPS